MGLGLGGTIREHLGQEEARDVFCSHADDVTRQNSKKRRDKLFFKLTPRSVKGGSAARGGKLEV